MSNITTTIPESNSAGSTVVEIPFISVVDDYISEAEQRFAVIAELGSDVPEGAVCFQRQGIECSSRRDAVEIRIIDNDRRFFFIYATAVICEIFAVAMTIGFSERRMTVSEGEYGYNFIRIEIDILASRISELEYETIVQLLEPKKDAIVVPFDEMADQGFDALFGFETIPGGSLIEVVYWPAIAYSTLSTAFALVVNDIIIEDEECFTLSVSSSNILGENVCNDGERDETFYFCEHTICIEDNDGKEYLRVHFFYSY